MFLVLHCNKDNVLINDSPVISKKQPYIICCVFTVIAVISFVAIAFISLLVIPQANNAYTKSSVIALFLHSTCSKLDGKPKDPIVLKSISFHLHQFYKAIVQVFQN